MPCSRLSVSKKEYTHDSDLALQRISDVHRPSRVVLAPTGVRCTVRNRHQALPAAGPDRRARHVRFDLFRRQPPIDGQCRAPPVREPGALADSDGCIDRHRTNRSDCHCHNELQRTVQPRSCLRLPRPHLGRSCRLEHRHHGGPRGGTELQPRRAAQARRSVCPRGGIRRRGSEVVGQLGRRCHLSGQGVRRMGTQRQGENRRSSRRILLGPRAVECPPPDPGLSASGAGGLVRGRQRSRGPVRRGSVHRAADHRRCSCVLRGSEGAGCRGRSKS